MQGIVLCPKCRVQVKKDNLGEFLCPICGVRLCPKAHITDGKICTYCGWEDPNYYLWQKTQKAGLQSRAAKKSEQPLDSKPQYVCPHCYTEINTPRGVCPNQRGCGYSGPMQRRERQQPASTLPDDTSLPYKSTPRTPSQPSIPPPQKQLLRELAKAKWREWNFPPLRRFLRPILASLLVGIVVSGLVLGGIYTTRLISQSPNPGTQPPPLPTTTKTYILSRSAVPEGGGSIVPNPPSDIGTYKSGTPITLTATPTNDCYTFSYWEGISGSSETITITMDSNKNVTAHFRLKDTTPPVISEVKTTSYSDISATIIWLTDEPATSEVEYGKTKDYGQVAQSKGEPTTTHKVRLTALEANTTYYFRVKTKDACRNEATSDTKTLKTLHEISAGHEVGKRAPNFELREYQDNDNPRSPNNGEIVRLSDYIGKRKILLNFWNTFCAACLLEFPHIRGIYEDKNWADNNSEHSDVAVLTICLDGRVDRIEKLKAKYSDDADIGPFTFPILLDAKENSTKDKYRIWTLPATFFIDEDGIIREIKIGRFNNKEEIETILDRPD